MWWKFEYFVNYSWLPVIYEILFQKFGNQPKCFILELGKQGSLRVVHTNSLTDQRGLNVMEILRFRYTGSCHLRNFGPCLSQFQFARIHIGSLVNIEMILNRPITKFYNRDDVKSRLTQSHGSLKGSQLKQFQQMKIKFSKLNVKNASVCMAHCKLISQNPTLFDFTKFSFIQSN